MTSRLLRCREVTVSLGLDGLLVTDPVDVRYLSGFLGDDATLVVGPDAALICTDSRFWAQAREEVDGFELVEVTGADLLEETARAAAGALGTGAALGYQGGALSHAGYRRLRRVHDGGLRDVGEKVAGLRLVKDAAEIEAVRKASVATVEAVALVVGRGLLGRREQDVAWDLTAEYHRLGAEGEAFPAIVAAGEHGAQAHAVPGARVIERGDLVVIDTGARWEGYCSDITRTFAAGEPGDHAREVYDVVLRAQLAGLGAVRAGAHGRVDVDAAARAVIAAAGYGGHFGHGTGHGVGLEVHEGPTLGRLRGDRLDSGMVCTVEPGIYLDEAFGVRIEDTVVVTGDGCDVLTTSPKELQVLD